MSKTINRVGRMYFWEFIVLAPVLVAATEALSRSGWDGVAQASLLYGGLFGAFLLTALMAITFGRCLDRLGERSAWFASWIDGKGVLGVLGYMLLVGFCVVDFILHPWVPGLLLQAICRTIGAGD